MSFTRVVGIAALIVTIAVTNSGISEVAMAESAVAARGGACPSTSMQATPSTAEPPSPSTSGTACGSEGKTAGPSSGSSPHFTPGARDGLACSPEGATVKGVNGTTFICAKKSGRSQSVWGVK